MLKTWEADASRLALCWCPYCPDGSAPRTGDPEFRALPDDSVAESQVLEGQERAEAEQQAALLIAGLAGRPSTVASTNQTVRRPDRRKAQLIAGSGIQHYRA